MTLQRPYFKVCHEEIVAISYNKIEGIKGCQLQQMTIQQTNITSLS